MLVSYAPTYVYLGLSKPIYLIETQLQERLNTDEIYLFDKMASVEDELNALVRADIYKSKDDVISDALRALLTLRPGLKV